jgi:hypothetical protein
VVALSDDLRSPWDQGFAHPVDEVLHREYAEALVRRRLHQPMFRYRLLSAYGRQCALCRLRHTPLLDAAHIKEDSEGANQSFRTEWRCAPSITGRSIARFWESDPTTSSRFARMF